MSIESRDVLVDGHWRACMFDTTGGRFLGPEFFDADEIDSFLGWLAHHAFVRDVRQLSAEALDHLHGQWVHYITPAMDSGEVPEDDGSDPVLVAELEASLASKRGTRAANAPVGGL